MKNNKKSNTLKYLIKYLILTGILFMGFFGASWVGFVDMTSKLSAGVWVLLFVWYFAFISLGDILLRKVLV